MDFSDALMALKQNKKVRCRTWDLTIYLCMIGNEIKCFREEAVTFNYSLDIINSNDWVMAKGDQEQLYPFSEAVKLLIQGEELKLKEWPKDCYIELTKNKKEVFMRKTVSYEFIPTFECFGSEEWKIIKE